MLTTDGGTSELSAGAAMRRSVWRKLALPQDRFVRMSLEIQAAASFPKGAKFVTGHHQVR